LNGRPAQETLDRALLAATHDFDEALMEFDEGPHDETMPESMEERATWFQSFANFITLGRQKRQQEERRFRSKRENLEEVLDYFGFDSPLRGLIVSNWETANKAKGHTRKYWPLPQLHALSDCGEAVGQVAESPKMLSTDSFYDDAARLIGPRSKLRPTLDHLSALHSELRTQGALN
jgi:hypothetical protein